MSFARVMSFFDPFGAVPGSSLNWSQHALLERRGGSTVATGPVIDTYRISRALEGVGQSISGVVDAIDELVSDLDLRLDAQTTLLSQQVDLLIEIAQTLRSPARTRAAERVRDAAELLRHHRNERALSVAEQAIDDDPNNDLAFVLAAWASLGIQDMGRARGYFREAAQATAFTEGAGQRHMNAVHLAARVTFILDGPEMALAELDSANPFIANGVSEKRPRATREMQLALLDPNRAGVIKFDRAVYYTASGRADEAATIFQGIAEEHDIRFCLMALTDPVLTANELIVNAAQEALREHRVQAKNVRQFLTTADARWKVLSEGVEQHEIQNADTARAQRLLGEILVPGTRRRKSIDEQLEKFPSNRLLKELAFVKNALDSYEASVTPVIEHERGREAALEARVQNALQQHRTALVVHRSRLQATVGRFPLIGGFTFEKVTVDESGVTYMEKLQVTQDLVIAYNQIKMRQ